MVKIEIIAFGNNKIYSAGKVHITPKGDVYHAFKIKNDNDGSHISRHSSGIHHLKLNKFREEVRKGIDIKNFSGLEFLDVQGFGLDSLPELYNEYRMKKSDGVFAIDIRNYKEGCFNLAIAIFTDEGLPKLFNSYKTALKKQIYIYTDCNPKIALIALEIQKK